MTEYAFAIITDSADEGSTSEETYETYDKAYGILWEFITEGKQYLENMSTIIDIKDPEPTYPRAYIFDLETNEDREMWEENRVKDLMDRENYYWDWHDVYESGVMPSPWSQKKDSKMSEERKSIEITLNPRGLSEITLKVFVTYELDYVLLTVEDRLVFGYGKTLEEAKEMLAEDIAIDVEFGEVWEQ